MNAPRSINLNVWWWVIFVSSSVVAAYAVAMCIVPAMRSTFVADIVDVRPVAAFSHFLGSSVALIAGTLQINRVIRVNRPVLHRWLGRIYLVGIAFGASSGLAMSVEASGGWLAQGGFALLAVCWIIFSILGFVSARAMDIQAHRKWMARSFALTFGAVTLRIYLPSFLAMGLPFDKAYPLVAWVSWVPNLLAVELFWLLPIVSQGSPLGFRRKSRVHI